MLLVKGGVVDQGTRMYYCKDNTTGNSFANQDAGMMDDWAGFWQDSGHNVSCSSYMVYEA